MSLCIQSQPCQVCFHQENLKPFPCTESDILHVMNVHGVFHPMKVQMFVNADLTTISDVVNKEIGKNTYIWIKETSTTPICHCCPNLSFPSWDHAVEHTMAYHKMFDPYIVCQVQFLKSGKSLNISVSFANNQDSILKNYMRRPHGLLENNALTLANVHRNLSIFDEVKKEVIEETNSKV